jgi:mannosyltransferase OCH1-like enzyme
MIPKIIHQIWIGDKVKPQLFLDSFKHMHPDYEYILWDDKEIEKRNMIFECQKQINDNNSFAGKADIMRYEILYKYGGIYIDADTFCLERIDDIMNEESFHYENEEIRQDLVANGFIIVKPNNIIMRKCIDEIKKKENINDLPTHIGTGPQLLTKHLHHSDMKFKILPSYTFLPYHFLNNVYLGKGKVYGFHFWGTTIFTNHNYDEDKIILPENVISKCKDNMNNNFTIYVNKLIKNSLI